MNERRAKPRLVISRSSLAQRRLETLRARAEHLFPMNSDLAARWVQARMYLGDRKPGVEIGAQRIDTSRALRALPIGSIAETVEIPQFLRRFFKESR